MLRIILITQGLNPIVTEMLQSKHRLIGIVEAVSKTGTPESFAFKVIRKISLKPITLKDLTEKKRIPYYLMNKRCNKALEQWIKKLTPDLIVVFSMSELLKKNIYEIPKKGTINIHPSYLPEYRGPNPDFWIYYYMEKRSGVTIHYIDEGEDTGDIIYRQRIKITPGMKHEPYRELLINNTAIKLLTRTLNDIDTNSVKRIQQPLASLKPRARNIKIKEHKTIIAWQEWPIERIWHLLRGNANWLNAIEPPKGRIYLKNWEIEGYEKIPLKEFDVSKVFKDKKGFFLSCRDGKIYLKRKTKIRIALKLLKGEING